MGISASVPPNQSAKRSGSVHSLHARSRGASKTRVIVSPSPAAEPSAMVRVLPSRSQAGVELLEAALPEATVSLQPIGGGPERRSAQARGSQLRRPPAGDQPGLLEHLQVLGHGLNADRK